MPGYKNVDIIPDREEVIGAPISLTPFHTKQTVWKSFYFFSVGPLWTFDGSLESWDENETIQNGAYQKCWSYSARALQAIQIGILEGEEYHFPIIILPEGAP